MIHVSYWVLAGSHAVFLGKCRGKYFGEKNEELKILVTWNFGNLEYYINYLPLNKT